MDAIEELLTRGVENIIPGKEKLRELLTGGKKLNIYLGIDPTATNIHIGHAVPLRKLNAFAQEGHNVTFLIGDFTALIGDTSDKDTERPILTSEQIETNFQTYKKQAEKVLDFSKVKVRFNSEWLKDLKFAEIVKLTQHFSAGDFVSRELIKNRLNSGKKVGLHELLYPIMQGYDSFHMDTDIQLGGTDQTFNMQAGRVLQKDLRNKESFIIANGFLEGTDGRKMSKSWGNAIWLTDLPNDMFGKVMSLRDELIINYLTLATSTPLGEIEKMHERLTAGENPMVIKKILAHRVVTELHSASAADQAQKQFEELHQQKNTTNVKLPIIALPTGATIFEALSCDPFNQSTTEMKRNISAGSVDINDQTISRLMIKTVLKNNDIIKFGTKKIAKVKLT